MHRVAALHVVETLGAVGHGELGTRGQGTVGWELGAAPLNEHLLQRLAPDRLGEVVVHSGVGALLSVALDRRCRHGDDGYVSRVLLEGSVMTQAKGRQQGPGRKIG